MHIVIIEKYFYRHGCVHTIHNTHTRARHLSASRRVIGEMECQRSRNELEIIIIIHNLYKYMHLTRLSLHIHHENVHLTAWVDGCTLYRSVAYIRTGRPIAHLAKWSKRVTKWTQNPNIFHNCYKCMHYTRVAWKVMLVYQGG